MKRVYARLEEKKEVLGGHKFFEALRSPDLSYEKKLSFAPAMTFYVMAFRDLLHFLHEEPPSTDIQRMINAYVGEDITHYLWYLEDLEKLGVRPLEGLDLWSQDLLPARRTIYRLIGCAVETQDPLQRLLMVMMFEATGDVFLGSTYEATKGGGVANKFRYFGKEHFEEESTHTVRKEDIDSIVAPANFLRGAFEMVDSVFADYGELFDCWYQRMSDSG